MLITAAIRKESLFKMKMCIHILQMLVSEIEMKQSKIDECQKYAEQYSAAVKVINTGILKILLLVSVSCGMLNILCVLCFLQDYELQTMTYRAMVDSQQKSPVKRRRMQSSSDFIIQEVNKFLMIGKLHLCFKLSKQKNGIQDLLMSKKKLESKSGQVLEKYLSLLRRLILGSCLFTLCGIQCECFTSAALPFCFSAVHGFTDSLHCLSDPDDAVHKVCR